MLVVECLPQFLKGRFVFPTPIAQAVLVNYNALVLTLIPVGKRGYAVRHPHRLHLDPTAAPTLVPLIILAVLVVVVRPVHLAVITRVVVRRGQSAGEYVHPS